MLFDLLCFFVFFSFFFSTKEISVFCCYGWSSPKTHRIILRYFIWYNLALWIQSIKQINQSVKMDTWFFFWLYNLYSIDATKKKCFFCGHVCNKEECACASLFLLSVISKNKQTNKTNRCIHNQIRNQIFWLRLQAYPNSAMHTHNLLHTKMDTWLMST